MRSVRTAVAGLLILGLLLAGGNLWTAAARSTILSTLNGTVTAKETRFEKHKGKDDVYLIWLGRECHQVDKSVYDSLESNSHVEKQRGSNLLNVDGAQVELTYSRDALGMLPATAILIVILGITSWLSCRFAQGSGPT